MNSWQIGRHSLRAGLDWRRLKTDFTLNNPQEGIYFFNANQVKANTALIGLATTSPRATGQPGLSNFSTFVEDEWKVNSRLSLSLGLRWDINPAPADASGGEPFHPLGNSQSGDINARSCGHTAMEDGLARSGAKTRHRLQTRPKGGP